MLCPECGGVNVYVKDSRERTDKNYRRRRYQCEDCKCSFTTYERVERILSSNGKRYKVDREL